MNLELERWSHKAQAALTGLATSFEDAFKRVPGRPGLYAIHASGAVWLELGLGEPPDARPLYVGKSESSLISRDLGTHFRNGKTGWSSPRRSFAALLHDSLDLRGMPRSVTEPGEFDRFGLSAEHDALLTAWMQENLSLAVWAKPTECTLRLRDIESELIRRLAPPLNIDRIPSPWRAYVRSARRLMADEARACAARARR